jgi:hypothetical protein
MVKKVAIVGGDVMKYLADVDMLLLLISRQLSQHNSK